MKEILSNPDLMSRVLFDEKTKKYFIEVVCGGIGMYDVTVPMLDHEIEDFQIDPDRMKYVVREITSNPEKAVKDRGGKFGEAE